MSRDLESIALGDSSAAAAPARALTRLVVLPFRVLRPDPEIDFLGLALADAVSSSLSGQSSLVVRSSAAGSRFSEERDVPSRADPEAARRVVGDDGRRRDHQLLLGLLRLDLGRLVPQLAEEVEDVPSRLGDRAGPDDGSGVARGSGVACGPAPTDPVVRITSADATTATVTLKRMVHSSDAASLLRLEAVGSQRLSEAEPQRRLRALTFGWRAARSRG